MKQPAFTLLEMILAMIIAGTIIGLTFGIFLNVQSTWGLFHKNQEKITMLLHLKNTLERDMDAAAYIYSESKNTVQLSAVNDTILYSFNDSQVVRYKHNIKDTFFTEIRNLNLHYLSSVNTFKIINEIQFDISIPFSLHGLTFSKYYTSKDLMLLTKNTDGY